MGVHVRDAELFVYANGQPTKMWEFTPTLNSDTLRITFCQTWRNFYQESICPSISWRYPFVVLAFLFCPFSTPAMRWFMIREGLAATIRGDRHHPSGNRHHPHINAAWFPQYGMPPQSMPGRLLVDYLLSLFPAPPIAIGSCKPREMAAEKNNFCLDYVPPLVICCKQYDRSSCFAFAVRL